MSDLSATAPPPADQAVEDPFADSVEPSPKRTGADAVRSADAAPPKKTHATEALSVHPTAHERYERTPKSDRRKWIDAGVSLALVAVGIAALVILKNLKEPARPVNRVSPAPLVEVAEITPHVGGLDVTSDGVVVPYRLINVGAEVAGRVVSMDPSLRSGRYVTAGQTLLTIDPETYRLEVKRLDAEVRSADRKLAELEVQIENARGTVSIAKKDAELAAGDTARQERLQERGSGSIAAVEQARRTQLQAVDRYQTANSSLKLLTAQREGLEVQKELTETALERARLDLSRTEVKSPVDGIVVSSDVEEGGRVQVGGALFTVNDTSQAEVRTNLQMKDVAWILAHPPEGTRATDDTPEMSADAAAYALPSVPVTVNYELAGNVYTWDGILSRAAGAGIDERTRTVPCLVRVANPRSVSMKGGSGSLPVAGPRALARGMFVSVQVHTEPAEPLLEVPEEAVRPGNRVWAVRDGKLIIAELPVAAIVGGKVLVPPAGASLKPGDRVVTSPLPAATPGMSVRVAGDPDPEAPQTPDAGAVADDEVDADGASPRPAGVAEAAAGGPAEES
ncbi:efflux RND transporter periplasmic adaptor subunit [Alienimonas chondri]|uniref:Multidrug resistance protein MdtA-like barrel-sandwich hybrid domain-containing protein n=1 Tax=Alienimonas chondri TaxID=2681879 RepID=A0ABX1VG04_9PLAN|nr:HlyD family efflux transporter periplasmic adaptor subunit [Alienimonas chondri]NNJ27042.1 hypothetical protein [Alienimonas chondri]